MTSLISNNFFRSFTNHDFETGLCFCSALLFIDFREVELEISFSIYFIRQTCGLTPPLLDKKNKENEQTSCRYFHKNLQVFLTNPNDNLKN